MRKKVLIISHERSGTHLLINTIAQSFGYSPQQIDVFKGFQSNWKDAAVARQWMQPFYGTFTPRIFKSHHSRAFLAPLLPELSEEFHIFYISRDGRDVMTSFWVWLHRLQAGWGPQTATVGEFMRTKATGKITQYQYYENSVTMLQRWVEHTREWKKHRAGIHFVTYEDLLDQFDQSLERISEIIGQPASARTLPSLDVPSSLPWKGVIGSWKSYFTPDDERYFDLHTQPETAIPEKE